MHDVKIELDRLEEFYVFFPTLLFPPQ